MTEVLLLIDVMVLHKGTVLDLKASIMFALLAMELPHLRQLISQLLKH